MTQPKKDEERPSIPGIITTAITVAGFAFLFLTQRQSLSLGEQAFFGGIVVLSFLGILTWVWYRPIRRWNEGWRRNRIARRNYPQLVRFCERFRAFTEYNMSNNPQYVIGNIRNNLGFQSVLIVEPHHANILAYELNNGLRTLKPGLNTFIWVSDLLTSMIRFYSDALVAKPIVQIRTIVDAGTGTIVPAYRAEYNVARERFVGFVAEYEEFISKTNKELGQVKRKVGDTWRDEELLRSYYVERPKEL